MKHILILLVCALVLTSCFKKEETVVENTDQPIPVEQNTLPANTDDAMVEKGSNVAVHYTGTLEDGTKFDSSLDRGSPLEFTAGAGQMIPGFDAGVMGMKVGDKKTLTLSPEEAYGAYDESKTQVVPRADLASFETAGFSLEPGEKIPTQFGNLTVKEATAENITLDLNHELAGKTLIFEVELMEIN